MAATNSLVLRFLHHLLLIYLCIYNNLASECPLLCTCHGSHNISVNCSNLSLGNLPSTSVSTLTLDLSRNALGPIINATFVPMRNLTFLDLSQNGLTRLLACTFSGMLDLRMVRLRGNRLSSLPDSLLADNEIEHLDLSFNLFTELPDGLFRETPKLKTLDVSNNLIGQLKLGDGFKIPKGIQMIDFSHNQIKSLMANLFGVSTEWADDITRTINFAFCGLSSIEDGTFANIPKLHQLDISGNSAVPMGNLARLLKDLETKGLERLTMTFMNLTTIVPLFAEVSELSLKFLNISFNSLSNIPAATFSNIKSLELLDLSRNSISAITEGFSQLVNLKVLNISYNRLEAFQGVAMSNLTKLLSLDVSYNKLSNPSLIDFSLLVNLNFLKVNNNLLTSTMLPNSTSNLQHLDYHFNKIAEFHGIDDATMLEFADFSNNNIQSLPGLLFKSARFLKFVNFSSNKIATLDHGAFLPQSSIVIDLSFNHLKELRYSNWIATQRLKIDHNELISIDSQTFYGMTGLQELDLSYNKLTTLHEDLLQYLTTLKHLNLSHNGLDNVQWFSLFRSLEYLVNLDLGYNNISRLNQTMFLPLLNIQTVSLSNNCLRSGVPNIFQNLNEIKHIDLSNNPFDCSCDTLPFREWLKKTNIPILGLYESNSTAYHCRTPHERRGLHVIQWSAAEFECDKSMLYVIVFCSTLIILTAVGLVSAAVYRFYRKWRNRKAEIRRDLEFEEERRRRAKKVDFVRLSDQKLEAENNERRDRQRGDKLENVDRRNGYVPWPGSKTGEGNIGKENEETAARRGSERGGGHYERLKRGDWATDKWRVTGHNERPQRKMRTVTQTDLRNTRDGNVERPAGRRESENLPVVFRTDKYGGSSQKIPSQYEEFERDDHQGVDRERVLYPERYPRYTGPFIISTANSVPNRWDNTHGWGVPREWDNQGYRKPRSQSHRMDGYQTMPVWERDGVRSERDVAISEQGLDRYPLEVHFEDRSEPKHYIRSHSASPHHQPYHHQRSQSYNYIPQDEMSFVKKEQNQRMNERIRQEHPEFEIGYRAASQVHLSNEASSDWL